METGPSEKFVSALKLIRDRVGLAEKAEITLFISDFIKACPTTMASEVTAVLARLQGLGAIKVIQISEKANSDGGYTLDTWSPLRLLGTYHRPHFDLDHLERNQLDESKVLSIQVNPGFLDVFSARVNTGISGAFRKIVLSENGIQEIDAQLKLNPIRWHCPIDRSTVATLLKEDESVSYWLEKFARGEFAYCKDRRHPNRFWIENGKISMGIAMMDPEEIAQKEDVVDNVTADAKMAAHLES